VANFKKLSFGRGLVAIIPIINSYKNLFLLVISLLIYRPLVLHTRIKLILSFTYKDVTNNFWFVGRLSNFMQIWNVNFTYYFSRNYYNILIAIRG